MGYYNGNTQPFTLAVASELSCQWIPYISWPKTGNGAEVSRGARSRRLEKLPLPLPQALSLKTEVPIIPTAMIKTKRGYKLRFNKPFYVPYFENEATSIQHGLKTLSKSFEELLALDINDWHSIQPVWTSEY